MHNENKLFAKYLNQDLGKTGSSSTKMHFFITDNPTNLTLL